MVLGVRVISRSLSAGAVVVEVAVETHSARVWLELHVPYTYLFFEYVYLPRWVNTSLDPISIQLDYLSRVFLHSRRSGKRNSVQHNEVL